ncbi:hypothetical protein LTSEURB_6745, partial [Salmonella enterica subsp. enterica serovar Urbana str. R8-2977]
MLCHCRAPADLRADKAQQGFKSDVMDVRCHLL